MYIFQFTAFGVTISPTYYGLMYALGIMGGYYVLTQRKRLSAQQLDSLLFYIFVGVILGGRLGYVLFYNHSYYLNNFLDIFKIWEGGMSFHGGLIGVILAGIIFSKTKKIPFFKIMDELALVTPIGLFFGRIGNYINKELLGYSGYDGPFAVIKDGVSYFPSPLLEALGEGLILGLILLVLSKRVKFHGQLSAVFLIGYAIARIIVEIFFRQPDEHIGYILGIFTLGEILTLPMLVLGGVIYINNKKKYATQ